MNACISSILNPNSIDSSHGSGSVSRLELLAEGKSKFGVDKVDSDTLLPSCQAYLSTYLLRICSVECRFGIGKESQVDKS